MADDSESLVAARAALDRDDVHAAAESGHTVDLDGTPTWYAAFGTGEPVVYLHGGFSSSRELAPVRHRYAAVRRTYTPERRGHGRTPDMPGPITAEVTAADTVAFLEQVVGGPADLVGYSDGGATALHVALRRPDLVRRLVLISTVFHHDGYPPELVSDPDSALPEMLVGPLADAYAEDFPEVAEQFPEVARKLLTAAVTDPTMPVTALADVRARTLVIAADDDLPTLEHTVALYRGIPDAQLAVLPGTSHAVVDEQPDAVARLVLDFLTTGPTPTLIPVRRATPP